MLLDFRKPRLPLVLVSALLLSVILFYLGTGIKTKAENVLAASAAPVTMSDSPVVILDAGHGGMDGGAVGENGVLEKDLNLSIALAAGEALSAAGFTVVYTRTDDRMLYSEEEDVKGLRKIGDLAGRVKIANERPDAVFLSIHMNSYPSKNAKGAQIYFGRKNEKSRDFAEILQKSVKENVQPENKRQIKEGEDIYILENAEGVAALLECGFISNPEECEKLCEKEYQKRLCFAIVCAMIEYKGSRPGAPVA